MKPREAIRNFIGELNGRIPPPVHTQGIDDSRPIPAVLIDDVTLTFENHHNSNYAGSEYVDGTEDTEIFRHYYTLRIELVVRTDDEVEAYDTLDDLISELSKLSRKPHESLHRDVNELRLLDAGGISYQFHEPTETEVNQSIKMTAFFETKKDRDAIENLTKTLNFS